MRRTFLILIAWTLTGILAPVRAQSLAPEVLATAGASDSAAAGQLHWTAGEAVINTLTAGGNILTQGFHQTQLTVTALEESTPEGLEVFPNPVSETLFLRSGQPLNAKIELVDMHGRVVRTREIVDAHQQTLDVRALSEGTYILNVHGTTYSWKGSWKILVIRQ
ncbi:MAG: T9SS type A sorting domain-containing protein [Bacteroidota bacterium]